MRAVLYVDGGARGNPGPAGVGIVLRSPDGRTLAEVGRGIGVATNNVAEYAALIAGLELALARGVTQVDVRMDSELVVSQVRGEWKIRKETLRPLAVKARSLLERFSSFTIAHVPRAANADADRLANAGMDQSAVAADDAPAQDPLFGS